MKITALQAAWHKARTEFGPLDVEYIEGHEFKVKSVSGGAPHEVRIAMDDAGKLATARCDCVQFDKMEDARAKFGPNQGVSIYNGVTVCKHILAAALWATRFGKAIWWLVERGHLVKDKWLYTSTILHPWQYNAWSDRIVSVDQMTVANLVDS